MAKESFAIEPGNAIVWVEEKYSIIPYCTRGIMQKLNDSRKAYSVSCDVIITVGDEQFFCHRAILTECIPYFDKMFRSCFKESSENVIALKNLDAKAFDTILESIYVGRLKFPLPEDIASALNIIAVCDYLGMVSTLDKCLDLFQRYLNPDTIFDICAYFVETGCDLENISKIVYSFILENFRAIYCSERFHSMPYSILEEVVKDDSVNATEKEILLAIDKWISYDERNRLKFVSQLTDAVRIPYLYNLSGIENNRSNTTKTILKRVCSLQQAQRLCSNSMEAEVSDERIAVPPIDKRTYKSIYFFCRRNLRNTTDVFRFDGKSLKHVPSMSQDGSYSSFTVVKLGLNFYLYTRDALKNTCFRCFNSSDQRWLPLHTCYPQPASNMVSMNNLQYLYVKFRNDEKILMYYIPALDKWLQGPKYPSGFRNTCMIAANNDNNVIYAFGNNEKKIKSFMLDVRVGMWSKIAPLPQMRINSAAAYAENNVFVSGGLYDATRKWCSTAFVYNVRSNSWGNLPSMCHPIKDHVLLPFENHLWAVGKDSVIKYSFSDRRWSSDVSVINTERADFIYSATVD